MAERRTTRCCSAVALIALCSLAAATPDRRLLPFFPVRTIWSLALNNQLTQPPAFDDAHAYFPIDGDRIVAYELKPGTQTWVVAAKPTSAPAAGGGLIFFMQNDSLTALKAADGSPAWQTALPDTLIVPPTWHTGWLLLASANGSVIAVRASDGQVIWRRDIGSPAHAPPAIAADRVYVPAVNNRVVALSIETGAPVWERRLGGTPNDILALDDQLFVGSTDNYFYRLRTSDGTVDWRWRTGADVIGMPVVDEQRVYFVSLDNVLRALNRSNGVQQWIQMLRFRPAAGPLKAGGTVIVNGLQPPLRAFNSKDGAAAGDVSVTGELAAPPHLLIDPGGDLPELVVVTRDIAKGATVTLVTRGNEPAASPFAPLPNAMRTVPP